MKTWSSLRLAVSSSNGYTWRRQRYVTTPMFTGVKLKLMLPHVCASAHTLTELVTQAAAEGELISIRPLIAKFSTEVIARVAFGIQTHASSKEETEFAHHCRNYFDRKRKPLQKFLSKACNYIKPLGPVLEFLNFKMDFINETSDAYFVNILKSTIEERKKERKEKNNNGKIPSQVRDLLDLFMEAAVEYDDVRLKETTSKKLSLEEAIGNLTSFIVAGVETVAETFRYVVYTLARYPDIQEKVIEEIDRVIPKGQPLEYEHLAELKYTEQVINEIQRMYPIVSAFFRWAKETKTYNGTTIPAGTMVHISSAHIMMDPDIWPEPEKFDPDRFSPENKATRDPIAFLPFGFGPRICLGQRLALIEIKVATVYLLRRVRFSLSNRSTPKKGVTPRQKNFSILSRGLDIPIAVEAALRE